MSATFRAACSRSAVAHLGEHCRHRHLSQRRLLGVLIIPVVQGRSAGIDAYTAICRALGILPGSPAQPAAQRTARRPLRFRRWSGRRMSCKFSPTPTPERGRAKVQEVCVACHGEQGVSIVPGVSASCRPIGRGDLQAAL